MDPSEIGCSLAEAADTPLYSEYLAAAAHTGQPAMHVVYINTSLKTKATAHAVVPTITCTSSNVVQTVLQVGHICLAVLYCHCIPFIGQCCTGCLHMCDCTSVLQCVQSGIAHLSLQLIDCLEAGNPIWHFCCC